ncbi:MAG TPA: hypothetical protein VLA68_04075 [Nitrososphaera sp.]|nr:hypothetical protein [Nitrososphaera sp.]
MPNKIEDLLKAREALSEFRARAVSPHHERYSFPLFQGSYFSYRRVDVLRIAAIANSLSGDPSYLDAGCGHGDFLKRIREFLPRAEGIEKDESIFYGLGMAKPEYVRIADARWISSKYDLVFVGWMEPGQDFRDAVAQSAEVIVTTLDQGISLAAEFDGHGFARVAWWRTPSWEDVNTEIMNRYYSKIPDYRRAQLERMRGAHNLWYVYSKPEKTGMIRTAIEKQLEKESPADRYDFEDVLDECGYRFLEKLENPAAPEPLWKVYFE